tara:strand:- start:1517 stop:2383 length:867 start_codon:yes stop_codon:yes gene_type:complete
MHLIFSFLLAFSIPLSGMGTQFLVLPSSAEELSMGSHATLPGLFSVNPALFSAPKKYPHFSIDRGTWLGDVTLTHLGYNQNSGSRTTHLGIKYSGLTDLEFRQDMPQDDASSRFSAYGLAIDGGASISRENQKFGFSISYINFGLYTESSSGIAINLGYALELKNGVTLGLVGQNIGWMKKLSSSSPSLPVRFSTGLSKLIRSDMFTNKIFGSVEWNSIISAPKIYVGNRFSWNRLDILTGYSTAKEVVESSIGIGLNLNRYHIAYGVRVGSQDLGIPKTLSLRLLLP